MLRDGVGKCQTFAYQKIGSNLEPEDFAKTSRAFAPCAEGIYLLVLPVCCAAISMLYFGVLIYPDTLPCSTLFTTSS